MPAATLTSKGQITLPKQIRDRLGLETGDRVAFHQRADGSVVVEPETLDLMTLRGSVRPRVRGVSLEDMDAAVRRAVSRRRSRARP